LASLLAPGSQTLLEVTRGRHPQRLQAQEACHSPAYLLLGYPVPKTRLWACGGGGGGGGWQPTFRSPVWRTQGCPILLCCCLTHLTIRPLSGSDVGGSQLIHPVGPSKYWGHQQLLQTGPFEHCPVGQQPAEWTPWWLLFPALCLLCLLHLHDCLPKDLPS
jgi:hypothetical protein